MLADAECYDADVCGSVAVHKDSLVEGQSVPADRVSLGCCDGADPCVGTPACVNQRCVVE